MRKSVFLYNLLSLLISLYSLNCLSQNFDVFSKNGSPEAKGMSNSGNGNSVDLYNGRLNTNIDLHNFKGREFDLPISMSYSASGVKVDQVASNVGLGWNLNVGGRVTRITRLAPDDIQSLNSSACTSSEQNYSVDSKMDFYSINAPGINDIAGYVSDNPLSTNPTWYYMKSRLTPKKTYTTNGLNEWILTDENGNKFYFGYNNKVERTTTYSNSSQTCQDNLSTNSLLLTKIVSRNNLDIYEFDYQNFVWSSVISNNGDGEVYNNYSLINYSNYKLNQQMVSEIKHNGEKIIGFIYGSRLDLEFVGGNTVGNKLNEIQFFNFKSGTSSYKKINFGYSYFGNTNPGSTFLQKRLKLDEIVFNGIQNSNTTLSNDKYSFEYQSPELVPSLESYARDFIGLYNGKDNNSNLISDTSISHVNEQPEYYDTIDTNRSFNYAKSKIGTLTKIIYPSKGFSTFEYEQNALKGGYGKTLVPATYRYEDLILCQLDASNCNSEANPNYNLIHPSMQYTILDSNNNNYNVGSNASGNYCYKVQTTIFRNSQSKNYDFKALGQGIYLIQKIQSCNPNNDVNICDSEIYNLCLTSNANLFYNGNANPLPNNFYYGGITNETSNKFFESGTYQITIWNYGQEDVASISITEKSNINPIVVSPAYYVDKDVSTNFIQGFRIKSITNFDNQNSQVSKKSFKYITGFKTGHVFNVYREATYQGYYHFTTRGYTNSQVIHYVDVFEVNENSNNENLGFVEYVFKPLERRELHYTSPEYINPLVPRSISLNTISEFPANFIDGDYYLKDSPFDYYARASDVINNSLNTRDGNKVVKKITYNSESKVIKEENIKYAFNRIIIHSFPSGNSTEFVYENYDFVSWKFDVFYPNPNDQSLNIINVQEFKIGAEQNEVAHNVSLEEKKVNYNTEEYNYEYFDGTNRSILENTPTTIKNSLTGDTKYIYTSFVNNSVTPNITRYFVSEVQHKPVNGTMLEPKTRYNYDLDGNMIEMVNVTPGTIPNNQYESYIYGYNNRFVVAKITGARYSDIPLTNITAIKNASNKIINDVNNTAMETALNALRSVAAIANAQITTTTINPVFGPTSVTEPKGYTIYSEYDVFGRPTLTKEKNPLVVGGFNILSETKYNTRPD